MGRGGAPGHISFARVEVKRGEGPLRSTFLKLRERRRKKDGYRVEKDTVPPFP